MFKSMFMARQPVYKYNGESRELPLHELMEGQKKLAEYAEYTALYPVLIDEGAVTRTKAKKYEKEHAMRDNKIKTCMPSIQKHLEALPLMLAEAETQDAPATALLTMQCDLGCVVSHENFNCIFNHKQGYICHPCSPPHGSACSD